MAWLHGHFFPEPAAWTALSSGQELGESWITASLFLSGPVPLCETYFSRGQIFGAFILVHTALGVLHTYQPDLRLERTVAWLTRPKHVRPPSALLLEA